MSVERVPRGSKSERLPILQGQRVEESTVYTDRCKVYHGLMLMAMITIEFTLQTLNGSEIKIVSMALNFWGLLLKEGLQNLRV